MKKIKLIVWDLDGTLFKGSIFYKNDEISLKENASDVLKELQKRGFTQVICSKNYEDDALKTLRKFDILKYFEGWTINWKLKSDNIQQSMGNFQCTRNEVLFIDDDPFQQEEVRTALKGIRVCYEDNLLNLLSYPDLQPSCMTETDKNRVTILKEQTDRKKAEVKYDGNFKEFLNSCNLEVTIREMKIKDMDRVHQLINRTNELNVIGNRWTKDHLISIYENTEVYKVIIVHLKDKFEDYGLIGEAVIETGQKVWYIRDLAVSCRTMGRGVGTALVTHILVLANNAKIQKVFGRVKPNEYNERMRPLFEKRGFELLIKKDNYGAEMWCFDFSKPILETPIHLTIK